MNKTLENTFKVSEKIKKMVEGSTEFNIEKFMSELEIENYREWLKVKLENPKESIRIKMKDYHP